MVVMTVVVLVVVVVVMVVVVMTAILPQLRDHSLLPTSLVCMYRVYISHVCMYRVYISHVYMYCVCISHLCMYCDHSTIKAMTDWKPLAERMRTKAW